MAILIKDPDEVVRIVTAGIEYIWARADKWPEDDWGYLRDLLHGASLTMLALGMEEQYDDLEFLRDVAAIRWFMLKDSRERKGGGGGEREGRGGGKWSTPR